MFIFFTKTILSEKVFHQFTELVGGLFFRICGHMSVNIHTFFMLFIAIWEVRRPAEALNWIIIVLVLPILGFWLYLSISNPQLIHRKRLNSSHNESDKLPDTYSDKASTIADALRHFTVHGHTLEGNPGISTPVIRQAYFICITQATKTIDITTPYFVPEIDIIMALKTAVARGVRVRLLVPHHIDQKIVGFASRTYYGELIEAGVQIYKYNKGMLHAKLMIIDDEIAEVGTANYDMRSFRLNYEVSQVLYSAEVAWELTEQFERDLTNSVPLRIKDLLQRTLTERIVEQGARVLSPLL